MLTHERLKELYSYNEITGLFTRLKTSGGCKEGSIAGTINQNGYCHISIDNKHYLAHRLVWLYIYGHFPNNLIDHINHNKSDNRLCNLREVTKSENERNATRSKANKSGVTGVSWQKRDKRWQAYIHAEGKEIHLGNFKCFQEAVSARKQAEAKYGFHKNHGAEKIKF